MAELCYIHSYIHIRNLHHSINILHKKRYNKSLIAELGLMLLASLLAISKSDAKAVLVYSTIANLGLIVACAGVGMRETIWAEVYLLILFIG